MAEANGKHDEESHYKIPDTKTIQEAGDLKIKDENGNEFAFKSLYESQTGRQLIVFIRHFYCGVRSGHLCFRSRSSTNQRLYFSIASNTYQL